MVTAMPHQSPTLNTCTRSSRRSFFRGLGIGLTGPLLAASSAKADPAAATYKNPLAVQIADPYVMREPDGTYFMYGTGGGKGTTAYPTFTSKDLVHWTSIGETYHRNPSDSWYTISSGPLRSITSKTVTTWSTARNG